MKRLAVLVLVIFILSITAAQENTPLDIFTPITPENVSELAMMAELAGHGDVVNALAFSPDGRWIATASWDEMMRVWDLQTGETVHTFLRIGTDLMFNRDGSRLVTTSYAGGGTWDTDTGTLLWWDERANTPGALLLDETVLATSVIDTREDRSIYLYNVETGEVVRDMDEDSQLAVRNITGTPDGTLVSGVIGGDVITWDVATNKVVDTFDTTTGTDDTRQVIGDIRYSNTGQYLAIVTTGEVRLRDTENAAIVARLAHPTGGNTFRAIYVTFNADDTLLATAFCSEPTGQSSFCRQMDVYFWDIREPGASATPIHTLEVPVTDRVSTVIEMAFSPDGRLFGMTHFDRTVLLWAIIPDDACTVTASGSANLRSGAGTDFTARGVLAAGDRQVVFGRANSADGFTWWQLYGRHWVREDVVQEFGDCDTVPQTPS